MLELYGFWLFLWFISWKKILWKLFQHYNLSLPLSLKLWFEPCYLKYIFTIIVIVIAGLQYCELLYSTFFILYFKKFCTNLSCCICLDCRDFFHSAFKSTSHPAEMIIVYIIFFQSTCLCDGECYINSPNPAPVCRLCSWHGLSVTQTVFRGLFSTHGLGPTYRSTLTFTAAGALPPATVSPLPLTHSAVWRDIYNPFN